MTVSYGGTYSTASGCNIQITVRTRVFKFGMVKTEIITIPIYFINIFKKYFCHFVCHDVSGAVSLVSLAFLDQPKLLRIFSASSCQAQSHRGSGMKLGPMINSPLTSTKQTGTPCNLNQSTGQIFSPSSSTPMRRCNTNRGYVLLDH